MQHPIRLGKIVLLVWTGSLCWAAGAATATHDHAGANAPAVKASAPAKALAEHAAATADAEKPAPIIDLKKAIREQILGKSKLTLVVSEKPGAAASGAAPASKPAGKPIARDHTAPGQSIAHDAAAPAAHAAATAPAVAHPLAVAVQPKKAMTVVVNPRASRDYIRAKAAALVGHDAAEPAHDAAGHGGAAHWSYAGATGPQAWAQLDPEFATCAAGQRQSPINIEDSYTLKGPAEPLQFNYTPANGTVINNGHTIQVEVQGTNTLAVRGSVYTLVQLHFHSPSEEQVNYRHFAMVAHLVHRNAEGQLAVVAVLLDPGEASAFIDKVWTYMPLDVNDQVRMPPALLNPAELLPPDQRYYQFIGSLTTPPCTEGVLWLVLKQPVQISPAQLRLFQQLYPHNARPVQAVNNRPVRNAQ